MDANVAVAYLRISTDRERQALGIGAQQQAIFAWAQQQGVKIVASYIEEASGGAPFEQRPVLAEAIAALQIYRAGIFVFHRWDRLARDPLVAALAEAEIGKACARLVAADGVGDDNTPAGRLVRDVLLASARFEKAMIQARIKAALAVKKQRGERVGNPPYGKRVGGDGKTLIDDPSEQAVVARIREQRAAGATYERIVTTLVAEGIRGRAGTPLRLKAVYAIARLVPVASRNHLRPSQELVRLLPQGSSAPELEGWMEAARCQPSEAHRTLGGVGNFARAREHA